MTIGAARLITNFDQFPQTDLGNAILANGRRHGVGIAAQLGGSGIQVGILGADKSGKLSRYKLDFRKYDPTIQSKRELEEAGIHNRKAFETLYQIINFVSKQAALAGQKTLDLVVSVAGFNTKNPPRTINPEFVQEAGQAITGKYFTPNIWWSDGGSEDLSGTIEHHISRTINFRYPLLYRSPYSFGYSDEGTKNLIEVDRQSSPKQNFQVMNDTCAVAASKIENLEEGDNAIGIVCGSGFNIGIAKDFDKTASKFRSLENTESGHLRLDGERSGENLKFISGLDSPLVNTDDQITTTLNRFDNLKNLSPETIFSGSCNKVTRSLKRQLQHLQAFAQKGHNDINEITDINLNDKLKAAINEALTELKTLELSQVTDQDLADYASKSPKLNTLMQELFKDYLQRLGIFIGKRIKEHFNPEQIKKLKAINISGSFLVNPLTNLPQEFKDIFTSSIACEIDMYNSPADISMVTNMVNLLGRDQMDGLADLIKFKAASARLTK